jgi:hypothetical protein
VDAVRGGARLRGVAASPARRSGRAVAPSRGRAGRTRISPSSGVRARRAAQIRVALARRSGPARTATSRSARGRPRGSAGPATGGPRGVAGWPRATRLPPVARGADGFRARRRGGLPGARGAIDSPRLPRAGLRRGAPGPLEPSCRAAGADPSVDASLNVESLSANVESLATSLSRSTLSRSVASLLPSPAIRSQKRRRAHGGVAARASAPPQEFRPAVSLERSRRGSRADGPSDGGPGTTGLGLATELVVRRAADRIISRAGGRAGPGRVPGSTRRPGHAASLRRARCPATMAARGAAAGCCGRGCARADASPCAARSRRPACPPGELAHCPRQTITAQNHEPAGRTRGLSPSAPG